MKVNRFGFGIIVLILTLVTGCQTTKITEEVPVQTGTLEKLHEEEMTQSLREAETEPSNITEITESVEEQSTADAIEQSVDIHQMVAEAIIAQSQAIYMGYECAAEGHIILDTVEKDGIMTIYAQTMYGEYQFHNDNYFVKSAGTGVIPCVMEFVVNNNGGYKLYAVQWPEDGSRYVQSIQEMFPEQWWDTCISPSEDVRKELTEQEQAYAREYMKQLGREAQIGDYADFAYTLLTEGGASVQASNALLMHETHLGNYPNWIGSHELIEDGIRYVYRKEVDPQAGVIRLTKTEYQSGKLLELYEYDWQTGDVVTENRMVQEPLMKGTHDVLLTQAPILKLQDMLSSTYKPFEIQSGNYEWNYPQGEQMVSVIACGPNPRENVENSPSLELPKYNQMEEVGYSVFCEKQPSILLVKEYHRNEVKEEKDPVNIQTYDHTFMIKLKPNRYYELTAVWEEDNMETNGFHGTAEYAFVTAG